MSPTITLLAASLMVGQADPSKPCPCQKNAPVGPIQPVAATSSSGGILRGLFKTSEPAPAPVVVEQRPTIISRIQGMFGFKKSDEPSIAAPMGAPVGSTVIIPQQQVEQPKPGPFRLMQCLPAGQPSDVGAPLVPQPQPPAPVQVKPLQPISYHAVPASQLGNGATPVQAVAQPRPNRITPGLPVGHEADYSWITGQIRIENGLYVIHYATPEVVDVHNGSLVLTSERDLRGFQDGDFVSVRGNLAGGANGRTLYRVASIDRLPR